MSSTVTLGHFDTTLDTTGTTHVYPSASLNVSTSAASMPGSMGRRCRGDGYRGVPEELVD